MLAGFFLALIYLFGRDERSVKMMSVIFESLPSWLENPMDRGASRATIHRDIKSGHS